MEAWKCYAYKIKERDGSISNFIFRDNLGSAFYPTFSWFMKDLLRNSRGHHVLCSPPLTSPEGEEWSNDEEFERICLNEKEINKIREYYSRKNLRIFVS
jgi:hypothetical protein